MLLVFLCCCGEKHSEPVINSAVVEDGKLVVFLAGNPTTGYRWQCCSMTGDCLSQEGETEFVPANRDASIAGSGGTEVFTFRPVGSGTAELHFEYFRSFEENSTIRTFDLTAETADKNITILRQNYSGGDAA